MTTRYVFAKDGVAAKRSLDRGISWSSIQLAAEQADNKFDLKLYKIVIKTVPGKREWRAWFQPIPANWKVRWVECHMDMHLPIHAEIVDMRFKNTYEHWCETPGILRYPIVEQLTASTTTTKITELK